jgi:peptidyl-prolyl cis-trans isomerase C
MYRFITACLTFCLLTAFSAVVGLETAMAQKAETPDPVATVNGSPIPLSDFEWEMKNAAARGLDPAKTGDDTQNSFRTRVLDELIDRELLYQESIKAGVSIDEAQVKERMDQLKGRFPDEEVFAKALEDMSMTEENLTKHIKRGMSISKYVDDVFVQKAEVSEKTIQEFYEEHPEAFTRPERVRARHILLEKKPDTTPEKIEENRELLNSLRKKVESGEDFGKLAKEHSNCPSSAQNGDLGFFGKGEMVQEFEEAAFALEPGAVSQIVETQFGLHLIQLVENQPESLLPLAEIKDRLALHLKQEKGKKAATDHLSDLKKTASIERMIPQP